MIVITMSTEYFKVAWMNAVSMGAGMIGNLMWIVLIAWLWFDFPYNFYKQHWFLDNKPVPLPDGKIVKYNVALATNVWIFIELINCCGLVFTNIAFLMIRSCVRHKL